MLVGVAADASTPLNDNSTAISLDPKTRMLVSLMDRRNNFDFLRILFASFVIITHSYSICRTNERDILYQLSGGQIELSYIGVRGFFAISGFLIFKSLMRSVSLQQYFLKRFLRLFPGLSVVLILTIFACFFAYESNVPYWSNKQVLTYLPSNLILYKVQYFIDGVFSGNPRTAINGSLWTLEYEFSFYILLALLFFVKKKQFLINFLIAASYALIVVAKINYSHELSQYNLLLNTKHVLDLGSFFLGGSVLALVNWDRAKLSSFLLFPMFVLSIAAIYCNSFHYISSFAIPIIVILFGLKSTPGINAIGIRVGDLSYGMYVYGWPTQQFLKYYFDLNVTSFIFLSLISCSVLAYFSWHIIEKRALDLINSSSRWPGFRKMVIPNG